jgi:hypothetical protein
MIQRHEVGGGEGLDLFHRVETCLHFNIFCCFLYSYTNSVVGTSVADQQHFDADPDPTFNFDADRIRILPNTLRANFYFKI